MMHPEEPVAPQALEQKSSSASNAETTTKSDVDSNISKPSHQTEQSEVPTVGSQSSQPQSNEKGNRSPKTEESTGSASPEGKSGLASGVSSRSLKKTLKGHAVRPARVHPSRAKPSRGPASRTQSRGNGTLVGGARFPHDHRRRNHKEQRDNDHEHQRENRKKEPPTESQPQEAPEALPSSPSLEARRSTYFSICLNASPDELTVVSYTLRMESGSGLFDDNWRRREAALTRYLLSLEDIHHPDVLLIQGVFSSSTQRLLKRLAREEPLFPFQTRVVGGDPGCCKNEGGEGRCSWCSRCWWCQAFPSRKQAKKKGAAAAFVMNNGWDSVCGSFSRFRGNGGIVILSKWPMLRRHAYIFSASAYPQSLSNAGAALVQVEKCGKVYNVLAMQLQPGANHNPLRVAQVKEVMEWARTGMEDIEKVEFASSDVDRALSSPGESSTRTESSVASDDSATKPNKTPQAGLPELESKSPGADEERKHFHHTRADLPKGILKATDPLIIGGNLNFRFTEDRKSLAEALGIDGLNANLALEDAFIAQPNFDTVNNDTCYQSEGCPKQPKQELLDYLLIYSEHAGRVARGQRTLVDPSPEKILYRPLVFGCLPGSALEVSHVSDFFPVCATFAHNSE
ncbi:endonuclease/exonuclease/phosphatase domain-containing protein, putative [Eimeria tenella]|uniref:Endonuclease/exonuclease/phosphatase domain-containing protein, putative n=1 Tax=Eimeria tenella TaxID=5802 RepID=U6KN56_EIMTE|nr:endonuclease/exonuclease/phosphatase domain-containing protein, putative [Eimeria tenella]CDJ39532.1 endonuclease/exonuclease/phosphatase domain-containing protein, putative [Eimeria tenella]|eukprot:XP_013230287.1 endonuclease/exonuclease/phosphatase domain-containing protein, putative [Eimeria tenella]